MSKNKNTQLKKIGIRQWKISKYQNYRQCFFKPKLFTESIFSLYHIETKSVPLIPHEQREKVREFIEELISSMIGGSIDDASVGQLFSNYACKYNNFF